MIAWFQYPLAFLAGMVLANAVPHFVHGISGNKFPTPFSTPRGVGLSGSTTNMLWSLVNLATGYGLFAAAHIRHEQVWLEVSFFTGITFAGIGLSIRFRKKHKE